MAVSCSSPEMVGDESADTTTHTQFEEGAQFEPDDIDPRLAGLRDCLMEGTCEVNVLIWDSRDVIPAETYVEAQGMPTEACPEPEIEISIDGRPCIESGYLPDGSAVIRYAFNGQIELCTTDSSVPLTNL